MVSLPAYSLDLTTRVGQPGWQEQWGEPVNPNAKGGKPSERMPSFGSGQWVATHIGHNILQ